jgi:hypothetical protein
MSIPIGTKVIIIGELNPNSPSYDQSRRRGHHVGHYLKDGSIGEIRGPSNGYGGVDVYRISGELCKVLCKGLQSGYSNPQVLHKGQFKIIKDDNTGMVQQDDGTEQVGGADT